MREHSKTQAHAKKVLRSGNQKAITTTTITKTAVFVSYYITIELRRANITKGLEVENKIKRELILKDKNEPNKWKTRKLIKSVIFVPLLPKQKQKIHAHIGLKDTWQFWLNKNSFMIGFKN